MPASTMRVPMTSRAQRLPEYNGPGQAPVVAQTSARLDDSAGAIATANYRNGSANPWNDVEKTFSNVATIATKVDDFHERYSKYKAQEALNNYQEALMVKKAALERLEGANAIGANGGKSVQQQLHEYEQELRTQFGSDLNERSRAFFDNFAGSEDKKNYAWAIDKERREWKAYQKSVDLGTIQTAFNMAENDPSPTQLAKSMGVVKATYEGMGRREGWSAEFTKAKVDEEEQKLIGSAISTMLTNYDFAGASKLFTSLGSKLSPSMRQKLAEAQGEMVLQQAQALAYSGDFAGARQLISDHSSHGALAGSYAVNGKSIAESFNNPLNEKRAGSNTGTRADFKQYETLADGVRGNAALLQRYTSKYGCRTLKDVIYRWAPPSENKTDAYLSAVARKTGIDPDKPIDFGNRKTLAKVLQAMAVQESPLGNRLAVKEVEAMLEGGAGPEWAQSAGKPDASAAGLSATAATQKNTVSLGSPALDARASHFMKGLEQAESDKRIEDVGKQVFDETKGLRGDDRTAVAMQKIEQLVSDPAERGKVLHAVAQQALFDDNMVKAKDSVAARGAVEQAIKDNVDPLTFMQKINDNKDMTQEAKKMAIDLYNGEIKDTPQTRFALDQLYMEIDRKPQMTLEEIEAYAVNHRMTPEQVHKARSYKESGGKMGGLKISTVETLWKRISGDKKLPDGLYDQVANELPDGKKPTEQEITKAMANLAMDGETENDSWYVPGYGDNETYREALLNGHADKWLPNISSAQERAEIEAVLKNAGVRDITDERVRLYKKKYIMGLK